MNLNKLSPANIGQRSWQLVQTKGISAVLSTAWSYFWLRFAGLGYWGRISAWLATWFAPPYKMRRSWARYYAAGYIAPSATIAHQDLQLGSNIFIGDRVRIFEDVCSGAVELAERVYLHNDVCIQTGDAGSLQIASDTHIQPRCQFWAYGASIQIGRGVQIAPNCAFYLGDRHCQDDATRDSPVAMDIIVEDDVWLGHGAVILEGTRIGRGAVIGSGAVVDRDIGDGAIVVGVPARVIGTRGNLP